MGRESDYQKQAEKDRAKENSDKNAELEAAWSKLGTESLSAKEMSILVSYIMNAKADNSNENNDIGEVVITEKTIRNRLRSICGNSGGLLNAEEFRESGSYQFEPEYNAMLLALMATDYLDDRKNDRKVRTRMDLYRQLLDNIDILLQNDTEILDLLKSHPTYYTAALESRLSECINKELAALVKSLYHIDSVVRYIYMHKFLGLVNDFRKQLQIADSKLFAVKLTYTHELDQLEDCDIQKAFFNVSTLDQLLIILVAYRKRRGSPAPTYTSESEILSPPGIALANELFGLGTEVPTVQDILDSVNSAMEGDKRYREIMDGIRQVLNLDDPMEANLFDEIDTLIRIQYIKPYVTDEEYNRMIRFTESNIAQDKMDLLNAYAKLGRTAYTDEQLDKIRQAIGKRETNPDKKPER